MHSSGKVVNSKYLKLATLGEGSSGKVYLVERLPHSQQSNENSSTQNVQIHSLEKHTKCYFALKKLKHYGKNSVMANREVELLNSLSHNNIVRIEEVFVVDKEYKQTTYVVLPYLIELMDLFKYKEVAISDSQQKQILWQLVNAIEYIHSQGVIHRDIKPSNVLISKNGEVKLADFDIATKIKPEMTRNMITRYYRAPEVIFGSREYSTEVDIWSLGCTICEMVLHQPIFPGNTDIAQLEKIFEVLGSPSLTWSEAAEYPFYLNFDIPNPKGLQNILPIEDTDLLDLITRVLVLNPQKRLKIAEVRSHPYFKDVNEDLSELSKVCCYLFDKKIKDSKGS